MEGKRSIGKEERKLSVEPPGGRATPPSPNNINQPAVLFSKRAFMKDIEILLEDSDLKRPDLKEKDI